MTRLKQFALTVIALFSLSACMTSIEDLPPTYVPPLQTVQIGDIEKAAAASDFLGALQIIDRLQREKPALSPERLLELKRQSLQGLAAQFEAAVKAEKYHEAAALYSSLAVAGEKTRFPDWSLEKLYLAAAQKREEAKDYVVAMHYYLKAIQGEAVGRDKLLKIIDLAAARQDAGALEKLFEEADRRGISPSAETRAKRSEKASLETMIGGTVTIWVNKGVKIERGSAMPDRVIGSGFFIDERGYLLTNYHVIESEVNPQYEGFSRLYVRLSETPEQKIPARVVGWDPIYDLALVKVEIEPKFVFSSVRQTRAIAGEKIQVIGSPVGLENTITSGIISARGRRFLQLGDALQIDAPINPGNSGGPVIDESGRLIGIVFAGIEQFEGINFAVSAEWINLVLSRLFQGGLVKHYWSGMAVLETAAGLEVLYVVPGEPADNAGLETGDILKAVNGLTVVKIRDAQACWDDFESDAMVSVRVGRGKAEFTALLRLQERPRVPIQLALDRDIRTNVIFPLFGMKVERVGEFYNLHYVVRRVVTGSIAEELDLSENDVVDIRNWFVDASKRIVAMDVKVQRKKQGFLEAYIRIFSFIETDNFI